MYIRLLHGRNWALRLSIVLNVFVLVYVCAHLTLSGTWIDDVSGNWGALNAMPLTDVYGSSSGNSNAVTTNDRDKTKFSSISTARIEIIDNNDQRSRMETNVDGAKQRQSQNRKIESSTSIFYDKLQHHDGIIATELNKPTLPAMTPEKAINCYEKSMEPRRAQRGDYWVLYNYVPMTRIFRCWESVTYTTHADYTFLDNLEPLLERWQGPVSIALYAPGTDFQPTVDSIKYARSCGSPLIAQFVTFNVYFNSKHIPKVVPQSKKVVSDRYNCSLGPPWQRVNVTTKMYKTVKNLLYPVNVGRNIAREMAPTHYVLASDIELYPSPNLTTAFLDMIARKDHPGLKKPNPKVFVLPIFEIDGKSKPPLTKTSLIKMFKDKTAISFHQRVCSYCHSIPKGTEWRNAPETKSLSIFHVGKRTGNFGHWEPIFIGTNSEPPYDERLSWEGMSDKMTQGYALCVLDYDFLILDNAFLVHRPGIKTYKKDARRHTLTAKTNVLISRIIVPELKIIYGTKKGCSV